MSEILLGVLQLPEDLFWADDPISRQQHDSIRLEAAEEIIALRARVAELEAALDRIAQRGYEVQREEHRIARAALKGQNDE